MTVPDNTEHCGPHTGRIAELEDAVSKHRVYLVNANHQTIKALCEVDKLKCRVIELDAELDRYKTAMGRERKADWGKYVKAHADYLDGLAKECTLECTQHMRNMLKSSSILLNEHWQCFTHKANFVPSELRIKELEAACAVKHDALDLAAQLIDHSNRGAFENGVKDSSGSIDEGEVAAGRIREECRIALATNPGQPLLDRLHVLETAQTACLGERDTALGRVKDLESGLVEAVKALSVMIPCFDNQHDESGLHQPTDPLQSVDYELATETLATLKPLISDKEGEYSGTDTTEVKS